MALQRRWTTCRARGQQALGIQQQDSASASGRTLFETDAKKKAYRSRTFMVSAGSRLMTRMVESTEPTARKRERCRPSGTGPTSSAAICRHTRGACIR